MLDTLAHLFTTGAYLPFALLLFYGVLRLVLSETHWLSSGRIAVYAAAVLAGLTTLVPILTTGATPNLQAIIAALGAAWALYISPHAPTPTAVAVEVAATLPKATLVKG